MYKRQAIERDGTIIEALSNAMFRVELDNGHVPVSYTHLDVYKRQGLGIAILSTSKGIMTDAKARKENVGGEVLCYICLLYTSCVKEVFVDGGRMLKRIQAAPQGRAHRIRKRSNHVTIVVDKMV